MCFYTHPKLLFSTIFRSILCLKTHWECFVLFFFNKRFNTSGVFRLAFVMPQHLIVLATLWKKEFQQQSNYWPGTMPIEHLGASCVKSILDIAFGLKAEHWHCWRDQQLLCDYKNISLPSQSTTAPSAPLSAPTAKRNCTSFIAKHHFTSSPSSPNFVKSPNSVLKPHLVNDNLLHLVNCATQQTSTPTEKSVDLVP